LDDKVREALNSQLNAELHAAYTYLSMSAHFQAADLPGFSAWMRAQAQEELGHAMRIYDFLNDRNVRIELREVAAPPAAWDTPLEVFEGALKHEQRVTSMIHDIVDLSLEVRDHATNTFLQWFVTEQVEEEATAEGIVGQLKLIGNDGNGLFLLDRELGGRQGGEEEA
jgi:ferritin